MIVALTNSEDATADYLVQQAAPGTRLVRIDTDTLASSCRVEFACGADGPTLWLRDGPPLLASEVTGLWNRRPRSIPVDEPDPAYAAFVSDEWRAAIEGWLYHIPPARWMNHPTNDSTACNKLLQITEGKRCGLRLPRTIVTQSPEQVRALIESVGSLVSKPLYSGLVTTPSGEELSIYTSLVDERSLAQLDAVRSCPTLFQERISKGGDVRATFVDGRVEAVLMDNKAEHIDIRHNNMDHVEYTRVEMPAPVYAAARRLMEALHLRFGAMDFVVGDDDVWYFLEVNPGGQWAWLDQMAGTEVAHLILGALSKGPTSPS